ncbi:uncharacterized protein LOC130656447 isoform X2 [Hydractinia symbiolongicarpus]|uniref:uncharacterized protein LOC130656447 isoform X2 n=1 Tax=Hydractinia symbiolongicarpus TaxID=13093 RepID=UPI00254DAAB6|nr:uncharacterized protein LOC130656447 isoform X2 [Hydractinia symbiolongicarpus]
MAFHTSWPGIQFKYNITEERGGDVNGMNADGVVPLHDGIQRGDKDIVEELLKNGADTNTKPVKGNLEGKSPIYLAIKDPELKTLLEQYAEQDTVNTEGEVTEDVHTEEVSEQSTVITEVKHKSRNSMSTSSTHLLNQPSVLPKMVTVDPTLKYLCPPPQRMKQFEGLFFVPPSELTVEIVSSRGHVNDIKDVGNLFTKMFQSIGITLSYIYNGNSTSNYIKETHLQCIISENTFRHKEEYKIQVNTHKVVILSSCTVSMFRGISTFVQCLRLFRGKAVPLLQISDWPSHPHRSVILDFQCNDIPHLDIFCETVDILALFKINQIQLNIQNIGEQKNTGCFNLREFFTLQAYCQKRFILVVPYIVIDEHSNLISHGNNGIFQLNIEKLNNYIDLFPSSNFLHVDLRHASSSKLIQQLHQYCIARNYHLQLTVNEIDMHLDHLTSLLNSFSFTVNLSQADRLEERIEMVDNLGLQCIVCYENNNLNRLFPNIMNAMSSVHEISYKLNNYNVAGLSTKLSSSSKKLCSWSSFLPTIVMTSFMGWNAPKELDETYIKNIINYQIYEDDNDLIGNYFVSMGNSLPLTTADRSLFDDMLAYCSIDASSLTTENLQEICKTIKVLKLDIQKMKLGSSLNNFFVEESIILLNVLFFLSRICYGVLNLQTKDKTQNLDDLSQLNKSDHSNRLMTLINEYEQYCSKYYKHSSSGYVSVELLKNLLRKILPKNAPSSGLLSMFTA